MCSCLQGLAVASVSVSAFGFVSRRRGQDSLTAGHGAKHSCQSLIRLGDSDLTLVRLLKLRRATQLIYRPSDSSHTRQLLLPSRLVQGLFATLPVPLPPFLTNKERLIYEGAVRYQVPYFSLLPSSMASCLPTVPRVTFTVIEPISL